MIFRETIVDPKTGVVTLTSTYPLPNEIFLKIKVEREPIIKKAKVKFKNINSKIYLERNGNKYHMDHKLKAWSNKISVDHFSFWFTLDLLNLNDMGNFDDLFEKIDLDSTLRIVVE